MRTTRRRLISRRATCCADSCREKQEAVFDDTVKGHDKITTFAAIPYVLKYGHGVAYPNNWKDRGYDTAPVAAPIIR